MSPLLYLQGIEQSMYGRFGRVFVQILKWRMQRISGVEHIKLLRHLSRPKGRDWVLSGIPRCDPVARIVPKTVRGTSCLMFHFK
jgi:hypothetical protein